MRIKIYLKTLSLIVVIAVSFVQICNSQVVRAMPDSLRKYRNAPQQNSPDTLTQPLYVRPSDDYVDDSNYINTEKAPVYSDNNNDSLIKIKLVKLAQNNPAIRISESNINIYNAELERTKTSWLGNISLGANINEFVISNSAAASFFPKYNLGFIVPFDLLKKMKRDKITATENVNVAKELKTDKLNTIKTEVLTRYEAYKELKELVFLQKSFLEYDYSNYETARNAYSEGTGNMIDMNRNHQNYLLGKAKLTSLQKEYNVAVIRVEEMINMPLEEALKLP